MWLLKDKQAQKYFRLTLRLKEYVLAINLVLTHTVGDEILIHKTFNGGSVLLNSLVNKKAS